MDFDPFSYLIQYDDYINKIKQQLYPFIVFSLIFLSLVSIKTILNTSI